MLALLLAGAVSQSVVDAERAFAATAARDGQWTAFRAYAAPEATMFVPQPVNAQAWLNDRKDPPRSIEWWPTAAWISCDGTLAVTHGGWRRADGSVGFFSTVWRREIDGRWRWIVDGGDAVRKPLPHPDAPAIRRASCTAVTPQPAGLTDARHGAGTAVDRSLSWGWAFNATGKTRVFDVELWDGKRHVAVLEDLINVQ